jgi:ribosomal protein L23
MKRQTKKQEIEEALEELYNTIEPEEMKIQ